MLRDDATLEDLQVVLDLVGVSAEAVEEVVVLHQAPFGAVGRQQDLGRSLAANSVTYYPQHLHLEQGDDSYTHQLCTCTINPVESEGTPHPEDEEIFTLRGLLLFGPYPMIKTGWTK